ncbi:MAG: double-strand break repair protein AddB [Caulobacteraceae bacterium]
MSAFPAGAAPRWYSIAAHRPFLDDLAAGLMRGLAPEGPEALSRATMLLPNRRTARALRDAFLARSGGRAILPPLMRALGDLDENEPPFEPADLAFDLPPAIGAERRRFELAGLVAENEQLLERRLDADAALGLADALASFLDAVQIEEIDGDVDLAAVVEGDYAEHWRKSADFLDIAVTAWPRRLADIGLMDVAQRRVALLRRLEARWRETPPDGVLIAAGSTGSTKATADLLGAIARAPRGAVVLPGLDTSLAETAWAAADDQHPQGALRRLLARAGVARGEVRPWPGSEETVGVARWRRRVINEALRPADLTADWLKVIDDLEREAPGSIGQGLAGLTLMTARGEEEAAGAAALMLRQALETPGRTADLVTPDAALARRVEARLARWNITADSSVGQPLALSPPAVLAQLAARASADPLDPVVLLALVKHPTTRLGLDPDVLDRARTVLERRALRGPRVCEWSALERRLIGGPGDGAGALDLIYRLRAALAPAADAFVGETATAGMAARALAETLEAVADADLWRGQAGEALAGVFARLMDESEALPPVTRRGFVQLLEGLLAREPVRPGGASHPRLRILGVLEARLLRADLIILAGLEEGLWPAAAPIDPFLSRPMRAKLGLPVPERRIGLAAHDFAQAACAPEVVLLHTARRGGAPTVQSRWLWRLNTLIAGAGLTPPARPEVLAWARAIDAPIADPPPSLATAQRPRPAPPVTTRPRELPVTAVERWVRDPYAVYAQRILGLRPLDPPDASVDALARGLAIHKAFERFALAHPTALPPDAEQAFEALILEELETSGMAAASMARERALARNLAPWVIAFERRRRAGARLLVEQSGRMEWTAPGGPFALTARADRIEARADVADILDFKTGRTPSQKQVEAGLSPQLTLTAAILAAGGFADLGRTQPGELLYVRVRGGRVPGEEAARDKGDAAALAEAALAGLKRRVARFDDPRTPYLSRAATEFMGDAGDFDHLARLWEWAVMGEAEGGE